MVLSIILGLVIAGITGLVIPLLLSPFIIAWHLLMGIAEIIAEVLMYILIGLIKLIFKAIKAIFGAIFKRRYRPVKRAVYYDFEEDLDIID